MIKSICVISILIMAIIVHFVGLYHVDKVEKGLYKKIDSLTEGKMDKKMAEDCHKTLVCKRCKHFKNGECPFYEENHYIPELDYEEESAEKIWEFLKQNDITIEELSQNVDFAERLIQKREEQIYEDMERTLKEEK